MKLFQTELRAFHGDPTIKQKYLDRVKWHQEQDNFIQGQRTFSDNGKGCAVGCTLDFNNKGYGWHKAYEIELGIHQIIARLENDIFERLPKEESKAWPYEFLDAIPVGADLSQVWPKFAIWLLTDEKYGVINFAKIEDKPIIQHTADLYQSESATEEDFRNAAEAALASASSYAATSTAKTAAYLAAAVADDAADDATRANAAASAARASYVAAGVCVCAAYADAAAAHTAVFCVCAGAYTNKDKDVILAQKNKLLELLKGVN